ncbi:transcriptional regulator [Aestuariivirga sp. YIM B02566]|uniref:Transcriptional regulator n=1 Tax=Taklimakanibacter albus TaxID=2800327 RepID=A0ACC5R6Q4_9HYPH|nr:transcriptional regulator [Aestuariivirga sp. YIM B02566]
MPDWIRCLAEACDRSSQSAIAKRLGVSGSVVSGVLRQTYAGTYETVEKATRGALMGDTLVCPVLEEIPAHVCLDHQKRARNFSSASSLRVKLYRACRGGCIHSRIKTTSAEEGGNAE